MKKIISFLAISLCVILAFSACARGEKADTITASLSAATERETSASQKSGGLTLQKADEGEKTTAASSETTSPVTTKTSLENEKIKWDSSLEYADYSKIHTDSATLYRAQTNRKNRVVCVNAGHGTRGGSSVKTQCHPDGSPKVTGGSTGKGATYATAVSGGMTFKNGTEEAKANLSLAKLVKEKLLENGYDVLMIREDDDVQLDNIARTVLANNYADIHIALHYDSTESDKGLFYMGVPNVSSYRNMEPVKSHWKEHEKLGEAIIQGAKNNGVKIFQSGRMPIDLTQTSYSTVASIDVEVGDRVSDIREKAQSKIADGIVDGIEIYFEG